MHEAGKGCKSRSGVWERGLLNVRKKGARETAAGARCVNTREGGKRSGHAQDSIGKLSE